MPRSAISRAFRSRAGRHALIVFPTRLAAYAFDQGTAAGAPLTSWIQVAIETPVEPRGIEITKADLRTMAKNFRDGKFPAPPTRICVDYDHLSLKPGKPGDGKAAGWFVDVELRADDTELWALVEWTEAGAEAVRTKEYQFVSPVIAGDFVTNDGEQIGPTLLNAAITNNPQLQGMAPVSLSLRPSAVALVQLGDTDRRDRVQQAIRDRFGNPFEDYDHECYLVELFGDLAVFHRAGRYWQIGFVIAENGDVTLSGDPVEVVATFTPLAADLAARITTMPKTFTLTALDGKPVQIAEDVLEQSDLVKALRAQLPPADAKVVTATVFDGLTQQVSALTQQVTELSATVTTEKQRADAAEQALNTNRAKATVDALVREGKLTAAQREWAESYCLADQAGFERFAATLNPVVRLEREIGSAAAAPAGSPEEQLDLKAKQIAEAEKLPYYEAYALATKRHPELLAQSFADQDTRAARH